MIFADKVLAFATKAHEGQVRKFTKAPYITHPIAVAKIAMETAPKVYYGFYTQVDKELLASIAYLHDVVEDTSVTPEELKAFLYSLNFYDVKNVDVIYNAVMALTKPKQGLDIIQYLDGIKHNLWALVVKLADLEHNMSDLKDQKKLDYYRLIRHYLTH
jgi:(p)ppGpp synthase/HD superfamily hydrolase